MTAEFTLAALLEMQRTAKAAQDAICCPDCGKSGVANDDNAFMEIGNSEPRFVHAACLVLRKQAAADLPKAGRFS